MFFFLYFHGCLQTQPLFFSLISALSFPCSVTLPKALMSVPLQLSNQLVTRTLGFVQKVTKYMTMRINKMLCLKVSDTFFGCRGKVKLRAQAVQLSTRISMQALYELFPDLAASVQVLLAREYHHTQDDCCSWSPS